MTACGNEKEKLARQRVRELGLMSGHSVLDPLLASLAHFDTSADLSKRIASLFQVGEAVWWAINDGYWGMGAAEMETSLQIGSKRRTRGGSGLFHRILLPLFLH